MRISRKKKYKININGNRFHTKDGTPERDFIHVSDLCEIHNKTYKILKNNKKIILNCGSGIRYSVLKVIRTFEKKIRKKFDISYKVTNFNETQTICSDITLMRDLLRLNVKKTTINELIEDYL